MMKNIKRNRGWLWIGALGALLGSATIVGCGGGGEEGEGESQGVEGEREGEEREGGDDD